MMLSPHRIPLPIWQVQIGCEAGDQWFSHARITYVPVLSSDAGSSPTKQNKRCASSSWLYPVGKFRVALARLFLSSRTDSRPTPRKANSDYAVHRQVQPACTYISTHIYMCIYPYIHTYLQT